MIADSDKLRTTFSDQLTSFEDRVAGKEDEVQMLAEIREAIGRLLEANGGSEVEVRRVLQERLDGKAELDIDTARRLFTLICVLHFGG